VGFDEDPCQLDRKMELWLALLDNDPEQLL
jgi:hypothetical protein